LIKLFANVDETGDVGGGDPILVGGNIHAYSRSLNCPPRDLPSVATSFEKLDVASTTGCSTFGSLAPLRQSRHHFSKRPSSR